MITALRSLGIFSNLENKLKISLKKVSSYQNKVYLRCVIK